MIHAKKGLFFLFGAFVVDAKLQVRKRMLTGRLGNCEFDCDRDEDCADGLLCADQHEDELEAIGLDRRKADCPEPNGAWNLEVCFDETLLDTPPDDPDCDKLQKCEFDCDRDEDCADGLLCADQHEDELEAAGLDRRKADCPEPNGAWNLEVCFDENLI